ncbi:histidine phosphatase family protein [Alkalihalobacterium elongatum]|uniref:histidine phosphatase family protein n=1 Tax=Alkalihalobacterium elongatum TaxID=2675466 RepID=UPI001C1F763C|nr:histidine phosphatase family protein [Alkalihalobacterium elongatum]
MKVTYENSPVRSITALQRLAFKTSTQQNISSTIQLASKHKPFTIYSEQSFSRERQLLNLLQEGGFNFYVRHAEATIGVDQPFLSFYDCNTQRNLSNVGRQQAIAYGETTRSLDIPIDYPIISSPFCRTRETAALAFEQENKEIDPFWAEVYQLADPLPPTERVRIINLVTSALELAPSPGTNKVIIGHNFPESVGLGRIPNMGTVVIWPRGRGLGYDVIAKLSLRDFQSLL